MTFRKQLLYRTPVNSCLWSSSLCVNQRHIQNPVKHLRWNFFWKQEASEMELFLKTRSIWDGPFYENKKHLRWNFAKSSILDVWHGAHNFYNIYYISVYFENVVVCIDPLRWYNLLITLLIILHQFCSHHLFHSIKMFHFYTPRKCQKISVFLTFSGGIKVGHRQEMG